MSSPSLGWERLRDIYYRSRELYTLSWDHTQLPQLCALSKYTHTIALLAEDLDIYTASGALITRIPWNHHINGRIIGLMWTEAEELCVVLGNGKVRWYYTFEGDFDEFSIGFDAGVVGLRAWEVDPRGNIVVMLQDLKLVRLTRSGRAKLLVDFKEKGAEFQSLCVVDQSTSFVALDNAVYKVSKDCSKCSIDGPFELMACSPDGRLISLYGPKGLIIVTSSFDRVIMSWSCARPQRLQWCGSDAVGLQYEDSLKLVAPGGDVDFYYDQFIIQTENDGLTILTGSSMEMLAKVGTATVECFKIGSRAKAAILMDAVDKMSRHSPRANENLRMIGDGLAQAVDDTLDAALEEFDPYWQKKLLKAAAFGKSELEMKNKGDSARFVRVCDELRILNMIRDSEIGMFVTYSAYKQLGISKIVELLVKRQKFSVAYQLTQFMKLPLDSVFISWACCKIKFSSLGDEELSQSLLTRFQQLSEGKYISFARVAEVAFQEGRLNLAKILVNFESLFEKQIPLLLQMEEHELALQKSIESQNIDLIMETLLILKSTLSYPQFFKLLNSSKPAAHVFEYSQKSNEQLIKDFYNQADRVIDMANYDLHKTNFSNESLAAAIQTYTTRNTPVTQQLQKQQQLAQVQEELTTEFNIDFTGLSLSQTLLQLLQLSQTTKLTQLVKQFKFPDRKLCYLKLEHYITSQRPDELYAWAVESTPVIGPEVIIDRCIKSSQHKLASRLLQRTQIGYDARMEFLIALKEWQRALDEAVKKRDGGMVERIGELCSEDGQMQEAIRDARGKIGASSRFF